MHNDKKFRRFYDKKMPVSYISNIDRCYYDRAYVKKLDVQRLSFSQGSRDYKWHEDWSNDHKRDDFVGKWIEHQVGRNADDVYSELCKFGWKSVRERDYIWRRYVSTQLEKTKRYGPEIYVNEDGVLAWFETDPRQTRRPFNRRNDGYVPKYVLIHNSSQHVPDFGAVRNQPEGFRDIYRWRVPDGHLTNLGSCMRKLPGKWYVKYEGKYLLLHIYIIPTRPYARNYYGELPNRKDVGYEKRRDVFEMSFKPCSVYTNNGILKHEYYAEFDYEEYNRSTGEFEQHTSIGNLGYGVLQTYISIKEAENELWKLQQLEK